MAGRCAMRATPGYQAQGQACASAAWTMHIRQGSRDTRVPLEVILAMIQDPPPCLVLDASSRKLIFTQCLCRCGMAR